MIITLTNQKGGTGKTTLTSALAAGLHDRGYKVLAVDLDAQMNLTAISGINGGDKNCYPATVVDCMKQPGRIIPEAIVSTTLGYDLMVGDEALSDAEAMFQDNTPNAFTVLKRTLQPLQDTYDFIVVDTPPGLGILMTNAIMAAQKMIAPIEASTVSVQGLSQVIETYNLLKDWNPGLVFDGVIINRLTGRANVTKELVEEIQTQSEIIHLYYYSPIRQSEYVSGAQANNQSIYQYMSKTKVADDFNAFVDEFIARNIGGTNNG